MAEGTFRAAAAQTCATEDLAANLDRAAALAGRAAAEGAELLALPECFAFIGRRMADKLAVAESLEEPGPILRGVQAMAREHRMWVAAGGVPERMSGAGDRVFNTLVLIDPEGQTRAAYRKIHLFDVHIPGRAELRESACTAAGAEAVVADTPLARLGLSICYDLRFPELYRQLALEGGAQVLLVPAAFTAHTGAAHWHTLLRARAIENQCFVLAAAQHGKHSATRESYGHSIIIDPWGATLAEVEEGDGVAVADIDLGRLAEVRAQMPCHEHRVLWPRRA
jgi:deaminated glutathione amidase